MDLLVVLRFAAALIFVVGLIGGLAWLARHFKLQEKFASLSAGGRRLKVIETLPLDHRRRLMIIRRDSTEHLIILGMTGETIVETDIPQAAEGGTDPVDLDARRPDRLFDRAALPTANGDAA